MKIDLLITPFNKKNLKIEANLNEDIKITKKANDDYFKVGLNEEISKLNNLHSFENIYIHESNKDCVTITPNMTFYKNISHLVANVINNNFFWYNCFTATFFAPNNNIFSRFVSKINNHSLIACPSTYSYHHANNLTDKINTLDKTTKIYDKYLKNNDDVSLDYHFNNFTFCLINIEIAKKIGFAENLKFNDEIIIDYFYRLKTSNIPVLTDFNCLVFNAKLKDNPIVYNLCQANIKRLWCKDFLHFDDFKKVYNHQFSKYFLKLQTKSLTIEPNQAILYVTTAFSWVNGMTKHVQDLIKSNPNKHLYVFESPDNPNKINYFKLNHFYNNILINVETYYINDFNHIQTMTSPIYDQVLEEILISKNISVAHIHILGLGHKLNFATICKNNNVKTIISIHDLYYLGGEYTQLNIDNQFDEVLLSWKYNIKNLTDFKHRWQKNVQQLFDDIDQVIFYTNLYYDIYSKYYNIDKNKYKVIEHGSEYTHRYKLANVDNKSKTFNLLYFGRIREEKGISNLLNYAKNMDNIHIYIVGTKDDLNLVKKINNTKNISYVGEFSTFEQLANIVKDLKIHAKIIPANWHEAFNFTLSEAILLGLYPIVYNFGALGSRLNDYKIGSILKDSQVSTLATTINKIKDLSTNEWTQEIVKVHNTHISTISEMCEDYNNLYKNLSNDKICTDFAINYDLHKITNDMISKEIANDRLSKLNLLIWNPKFALLHKSLQTIKKILISK